MKLTKLTARREWVNNSVSARPASWRVAGCSVFLIGHAGDGSPYYTVHAGGEWDGRQHSGGRLVGFRVHSFKMARQAAITEATKEQQ